MKRNTTLLISAVASALILSACNNSTTPSTLPTLGPTCTLPAGTQVALVYPAPNASGVVNSNGEIVIGSTTALPVNQSGQNWSIWYSDAVLNSQGIQFAPINSNTSLASTSPPFPNPNTTPTFANPQYQQQTSGVQFAAGQTVTIYVNNSASGDNCTPLQIGSFST